MGIFGKKKLNAQKVFDTVTGAVDQWNFTTEEQARLNVELADKLADHVESTLNENTTRSKTRRFIAIEIITVYLVLLLLYVVLALMKIESIDFLKSLILESPIATGFIAVIGFFFGGYYLSKLVPKKKEG
jgi:hypothetical protein